MCNSALNARPARINPDTNQGKNSTSLSCVHTGYIECIFWPCEQ